MSAFARPEIKIAEIVEVSQREVLRLSDIARLTGGNEEIIHRMDEVVIRSDARELLLSQFLPADEVRQKIRGALVSGGVLHGFNLGFKIPSRIKVEFSTTPISREEIERKVSNRTLAKCGDCEARINIQSTPVPTEKNWDIGLDEFSPKGSFLLPIFENGKSTGKWIAGSARISKLVPVTNRLVSQGERIAAQDVKLAMMDVTFAKDGALRLEDVEGHLAARSLAIGSPVWNSDLLREPAAKRGQMIKAFLGDEVLEISVPVQAEENGFVGDLIKVKNMDTQKTLFGMIVEKGVVKLQ
jgi:flagella basal body P-ring formation protein FlgA